MFVAPSPNVPTPAPAAITSTAAPHALAADMDRTQPGAPREAFGTSGQFVKLAGRRLVARDAAGTPVEDELTVLEALTFATQEAAVGAALVASWANGLPGAREPAAPRLVAAELPTSPALYLPLGRWRRETGLNAETLQTIDLLFRRLGSTRRALARCIAEAEDLGNDRALALHVFVLIRSAREFAEAARDAVSILRTSIAFPLDERFARSCDILFALLTDCIHGRSPCLENGAPRRPDLPQRRRAQRIHYGEYVHLDFRDMRGSVYSVRVYARDVSTGGLGLSGVPFIEADKLVQVRTPDGRRLVARLAWWKNGDAGLTFIDPLSPEDPLIAS